MPVVSGSNMNGNGGDGGATFKLCRGPESVTTWNIKDIGNRKRNPVVVHEGQANFQDDGDDNYFVLYDEDDIDDVWVDECSSSSDEDGGKDENGSTGDDNDKVSRKSKYFVTVEAGVGEGMKRAKSQLGFYFEEHWAKMGVADEVASSCSGSNDNDTNGKGFKRWLSLNVEQLSNQDNLIVQYLLRVEATLKKKRKVVQRIGSFETNQVFVQDENDREKANALLKKKILELPDFQPPVPMTTRVVLSPASVTPGLEPRGDLLLTVTVTPIFISTLSNPVDNTPGEKEGPLGQALKTIFNLEENYPDLQIETKDNVLLGAHKCILAGRSSYFRDLLRDQTKQDWFGGTIKILNLNAEPMRAILKWIYTAELPQEGLEGCIQEVLEAAVKFGLTDLMMALDRKIITFCNIDNMLRLHRTMLPRKNELPNAFADISKMIKEHISTLQLE